MSDRPNYYAIIPAVVRYADISDKAKLLYGELTALSNKEGYCWATNSYFASLYNVDNKTITRNIKELEDKGFIYVKYDYAQKETKRYIYILSGDKNVYNTYSEDKNVSTDKIVHGVGTKMSHIIIQDNNTFNNNNINTDAQKQIVYDELQKSYPLCSSEWLGPIDRYLKKLPYQLVIEAIRLTKESESDGKRRGIKYIKAICQRWVDKGFNSIEDVENDYSKHIAKREMQAELKDQARMAYIAKNSSKAEKVKKAFSDMDYYIGMYEGVDNGKITSNGDSSALPRGIS